MRRSGFVLAVLALALAGCGGAAPAVPATVPVVEVVVTRQVEVTRVVVVTSPVEVTRIVEVIATARPELLSTPEPTKPPAPTPTAMAVEDVPRVENSEGIAQKAGDVTLTVLGARLLDAVSALAMPDMEVIANSEAFKDATVIGALIVSVSNATDGNVNIYPDQGTVVVGSEQIELGGFMFYHSGDVGGEVFPGVVREGTMLFPLKRTAWADIAAGTKLVFEVNAPSDEKYNRLADKPFHFELTLKPPAP